MMRDGLVAGAHMRIALVEPSRTVQHIVTDIVGAWGHEVRPFGDAPEALAYLASDKDVRTLMTSTELKSLSGIQLVKEARMMTDVRRPLYIILMSSSDERSRMVEALDSGADDFISKPPAREELRARLRAAERITSMQTQLIALASTDFLTGLLNRRGFVEVLEAMLKNAPGGGRISVLICDLDNFKTINDTFGHEIGDLVLAKLGDELKMLNVPAGRLGGEEFGLLLYASLDEAVDLAERLREGISVLAVKAASKVISVTCSIGAAEWEPGDTIDSILRRADVSLYEAKRLGRNRVIAADRFSMSEEHRRWQGVARDAERRRLI